MDDSKLKDALRSYYAADAAPPDASARKRTLLLVEAEAARACGGAREADYIPLWRFVASQVRFVRPWHGCSRSRFWHACSFSSA